MSNIYYGSRRPGTSGHKLYFRASGTSTPQNTYTDIDLAVAHSNPVVCEADGYYPVIYLDPSLPSYRVIHTEGGNVDNDPTLEVQVEDTLDDVPSSSNQAQTYRVKGTAPEIIFEETDASTNNKKWRIRVNGETFSIDAGNDAESSWTPLLSIARDGVVDETGTFTATLTGMAASTTTTVRYKKSLGQVTLTLDTYVTGTSNTTGMTITGLPAAIVPTIGSAHTTLFTDSGTDIGGWSKLAPASSTITCGTGINNVATGFTASGLKGLPEAWSVTYPL